MKSLKLCGAVIVLSALMFNPLLAADAPRGGQGMMGGSGGMMSHPEGGMMAPSQGGMMNMDRMHDRVMGMDRVMERLHEENDPAARRRLMQDHMNQMQETMRGMQGMMGSQDPARMDMMQTMMEQMMNHMREQERMGR